MNYNWNWSILFEAPYLNWLLDGFIWTILVALAASAIAFTIGTAIGIFRTVPNRIIRLASRIYVEIFRNIPLIVQMFFWYFVLPEILPDAAGLWLKRDLPLPEFTTAAFALGIYTSSRVSEQIRAGIETVPQGLVLAAKASGMSEVQMYRHVVLPLALRIVIPPMTTEFLTIFKNSSIALTIGLMELTAYGNQISSYTYNSFEAFTAVTVIYAAIALFVTSAMHVVESRTPVPGFIGQRN